MLHMEVIPHFSIPLIYCNMPDLRMDYKRDTGNYPMEFDRGFEFFSEAYVRWLENMIEELTKPVVIAGEPFRSCPSSKHDMDFND